MTVMTPINAGIPAKAGIQLPSGAQSWTPAFAGVTDVLKRHREVI